VLDTLGNEQALRQFRTNLRRLDRASSLEQMIEDLEDIVRGDRRSNSEQVATA
jgi:hypothetical protein